MPPGPALTYSVYLNAEPRPKASPARRGGRRAPLCPHWIWLAYASVLMALAAGCARGPVVRAQGGGGGALQAVVSEPGLVRIALPRGVGKLEVASLNLLAAGNAPVRGIDLRAGGRAALVQLAAPAKRRAQETGAGQNPHKRGGAVPVGAPAGPQPFDLLPRESFAISNDSSATLRGLLLWEMPPSRGAIGASARRVSNVLWDTTRGLVLNAGGAPSQFELPCSAPLAHSSARIGWNMSDPARQPEVWLSLNNNAWTKLPTARLAAAWDEPYDFSAYVRGQRAFTLRFVFPAAPGGSVRLRQLRLEREVAGPGQLRAIQAGAAPLPISTGAGSGPLQLTLLGGQ